MVVVVDVSRADIQASHRLLPLTGSVVRCHPWFPDVGRPAL